MTRPERRFSAIAMLIARMNIHLNGGSNYFGVGYSRKAIRQINRFVQERLERDLKRRSNVPFGRRNE